MNSLYPLELEGMQVGPDDVQRRKVRRNDRSSARLVKTNEMSSSSCPLLKQNHKLKPLPSLSWVLRVSEPDSLALPIDLIRSLTGYIGGNLLTHLLSEYPQSKIYVQYRKNEHKQTLQDFSDRIEPVKLTLDDDELLQKYASIADVGPSVVCSIEMLHRLTFHSLNSYLGSGL